MKSNKTNDTPQTALGKVYNCKNNELKELPGIIEAKIKSEGKMIFY